MEIPLSAPPNQVNPTAVDRDRPVAQPAPGLAFALHQYGGLGAAHLGSLVRILALAHFAPDRRVVEWLGLLALRLLLGAALAVRGPRSRRGQRKAGEEKQAC